MLTDTEQLTILLDRWARRPGPFHPEHGAVVSELEDVRVDQPASLDDLSRYGQAFIKVLGSVYKSLRLLDQHLDQHIAVCRFAFSEEAVAGELRDVGAALTGPVMRWDEDKLLIAKPAKRYQWIQAAAILDADDVFGQLVEMGF